MKALPLTIPLDPALRDACARVLRDYDISLEDAVAIFLAELVRSGTLPFDRSFHATLNPVVAEQVYQVLAKPTGRGAKTAALELIVLSNAVKPSTD